MRSDLVDFPANAGGAAVVQDGSLNGHDFRAGHQGQIAAAETAKDVIIQIVQLDLKPVERDSRIASLAAYLFATMASDQWRALAISLAKFVAASPAASMSPATVSATQRAVIEIAGVDIGNDFGNVYNLAMQTVAGAPGGGKTVPPQPPPPPVALPLRPPVATLYEGQQYP